MYEILCAPDRLKNEVRGLGGVLSHLWRSILQDCNISLIQFDTATADYIKRARKLQTSPKIANYFNRSNIFREMSRPTMTFKVFLKALQLIGVRKMKITIEFERKGRTTQHSSTVTLIGEDATYEDLESLDEDKKDKETDSPAV